MVHQAGVSLETLASFFVKNLRNCHNCLTQNDFMVLVMLKHFTRQVLPRFCLSGSN